MSQAVTTRTGARDSERVTVEVLTHSAALDGVMREWYALHAMSERATLFQAPSWCRAVVSALEAAGRREPEPRVLIARIDGEIAAALPLCVVSRFGLRILRQLGEPISQYSEVTAAPGRGAAVDALVDAIGAMSDVDLVLLRRVRATSPLMAALEDAGATRLSTDCAPFMNFGAHRDPDAFAASGLSPDFASALKKRRKFGRTKGVTSRVVFGQEARAAGEAAVAMKAAWLAERDMTSAAFADPVWSGLLGRLAGVTAPDFTGFVAIIEADGVPIGYDLCFLSGGRIYGHVGAFDTRRSDLSPGRLAIVESVLHGLTHGAQGYDFMPPGDEYKFGWCAERETVADLALPLTTAGRVVGLTIEQRLKPWIKANIERLPASWRGAVARLG